MKILDKISNFAVLSASSLASLAKVALLSRKADLDKVSGGEIVLLGNGPTLRDTIDRHSDFLKSRELMAVNFAGNAEDFYDLRPGRYILADPHFFDTDARDPNVDRLWNRLGSADWKIRLYVPANYANKVRDLVSGFSNLEVKTFNLTPIDGWPKLADRLYGLKAGMPRPRNVLIPALMVSICLGFKKIYIAGADHSWTRTLAVDDQNRVVTVQPHFYKDNDQELKRVDHVYSNVRLDQMLESLMIAFRSYFCVRRFAERKGVEILNITPGSFIDAFDRLDLDEKS